MKHILWISRHPPNVQLMEDLANVLGDKIVITRHTASVFHHEELVEMYRSYPFDDIVVTLPIELIGKLCAAKIYPIRAVHSVIEDDPDTGARKYKFLRFERIHSVLVKKERLNFVHKEKKKT
jgi:hypothetical protein